MKKGSNIIIQKEVQDIIKDISAKYGLSTIEVSRIVTSQFDYVQHEMLNGVPGEEDSFKSVILRYFGTFSFNKVKHTAIGKRLEGLRNAKHSTELQS